MTDHPITPPPELVEQWVTEANEYIEQEEYAFANLAAQWGADQELEACANWAEDAFMDGWGKHLRAARRPKPPSLKQQALDLLKTDLEPGQEVASITLPAKSIDTIRRALEQLND